MNHPAEPQLRKLQRRQERIRTQYDSRHRHCRIRPYECARSITSRPERLNPGLQSNHDIIHIAVPDLDQYPADKFRPWP
jgi:hypothetical protein